jgi:hypothetical protein
MKEMSLKCKITHLPQIAAEMRISKYLNLRLR